MPDQPTAKKIKVITFDLDDTLWPIRPVLERAEQETYTWFGDNAARIIEKFDPQAMLEFRFALMHDNTRLRHRISDMRKYCYVELALASGYDKAQAENIAERAFQVFIYWRQQVSCFDGVESTLAALSSNYLLGALTNGNANLGQIPVGKYFDFCISAESLNASKPDPVIFSHALRQAQEQISGTVQPEHIVHVGDDLHSDIHGAQRAGFYSILLQHKKDITQRDKVQTSTSKPAQPDVTVDSISLVPQAIDTLQEKPTQKYAPYTDRMKKAP